MTVFDTSAVVNDHQRHSAIIDGENADRFHAVVDQIAKSLRFVP